MRTSTKDSPGWPRRLTRWVLGLTLRVDGYLRGHQNLAGGNWNHGAFRFSLMDFLGLLRLFWWRFLVFSCLRLLSCIMHTVLVDIETQTSMDDELRRK